jgi:hypothetical protein
VNVWSVEYEQFENFAVVEEFQDPEQFPEGPIRRPERGGVNGSR